MTRAVKETPVLTTLHELKERVKRQAHIEDGRLVLSMRQVLYLIEKLEDECRPRDDDWGENPGKTENTRA